jgi:hypothetical protein
MVSEPALQQGKEIWQRCRKLSADDISAYSNLYRLAEQREAFRIKNWPALAHNYERSVFYQLNLENAAGEFARYDLSLPEPLSESAPLMTRISDNMFRARVQQLKGLAYREYENEAFRLMRDGLTASALAKRQQPHLSVYSDQIVWGRSPVRIDLAGGWTDTPPYCLNEGGSVVNIAIELNGQPPLQVYVKPCREYKIILRSIDLGAMEVVTTYGEVRDFMQVGSPFSIPKAALVLAGFQPGFSTESYVSLEEQLKAFGSGMEITLLSAIPAGSGLGTSSILASTVLGAISDFCGLNWDKNEICNRTLILEQLLTTGGGWQDQYGGVLRGVKLLQTHAGMDQSPLVRWLPDKISVRLHISFLSQFSPQKSEIAPSTVDARIELVPRPEPAGIAESRVISIPEPNAFNCSSNETYDSVEKPGWKPASTNAALGIENGDPTCMKSLTSP